MSRLNRLRAERADHWIICIGLLVIAALAITGAYFILIVSPGVAVFVFALGIGCLVSASQQCFRALRVSRLIFTEESKTRVSRI